MKHFITLLLVSFIFFGCSNDNDDNTGTEKSVLGTWKLVRISSLGGSPDISAENIIYTFDKQRNLTINTNGEIENLKYEYKVGYLGPNLEGIKGKVPLIIFKDFAFTFSASDGKMTLGQSYTDGPIYYFEKQ